MFGFIMKVAAVVIITNVTWKGCEKGEQWARDRFDKNNQGD